MDNYFRTTDFPLASFLKMSGVDLREIEFVYPNANKCTFVFRIPTDDPLLIKLLDEWNTSHRCREFKQLLQSSKLVSRALKSFINQNKYEPQDR